MCNLIDKELQITNYLKIKYKYTESKTIKIRIYDNLK